MKMSAAKIAVTSYEETHRNRLFPDIEYKYCWRRRKRLLRMISGWSQVRLLSLAQKANVAQLVEHLTYRFRLFPGILKVYRRRRLQLLHS